MGPYTYPDDILVAQWSRTYGTTGVKFYELMLGDNEGYIVAYRELSLQERTLLARLDEIDAAAPDAFDIKRMIVGLALLYPALDMLPHPVFAIGELFPRVRQHGHGQIEDEETFDGPLPAHIVTDIRNARRAGQLAFEDLRFTSVYRDLILSLAIQQGELDIQLIDYLWRQTPGQLRDLLAIVEQTYHILHTELSSHAKVDPQKLATLFQSPFAVLDTETKGATVPGYQAEPTVPDAAPHPVTYSQPGLPPNAPPSTEALRLAIEGRPL